MAREQAGADVSEGERTNRKEENGRHREARQCDKRDGNQARRESKGDEEEQSEEAEEEDGEGMFSGEARGRAEADLFDGGAEEGGGGAAEDGVCCSACGGSAK